MPKYVIERDMPGAGSMSGEELRQASRRSAETMAGVDAVIHWQHTFVTDDDLLRLVRRERGRHQGARPAQRVPRHRHTPDQHGPRSGHQARVEAHGRSPGGGSAAVTVSGRTRPSAGREASLPRL
jgi:hypothetical protein